MFVEPFGVRCSEILRARGFRVKHSDKILRQEYDEVIAIFTKVSFVLNETFLKQFINLKFIVTPSTGTDTIKLSKEQSSMVDLITLRDDKRTLESFFSTREVFFWLLISLLRNTHSGSKIVEGGVWDRNLHFGENVYGKTLGILGFGRIGRHIADVAKSMGMKVKAFDINPLATKNINEFQFKSIDHFLSDLNVLSVNIDDRPSNQFFVNSHLISKLPDRGAYLINTSRGSLVDEYAIIKGLKHGQILGYGTDVLAGEGSEVNWLTKNKLWIEMNKGRYNIIITPHLGGATKENIVKAELSVIKTFLDRYNSNGK